MELLRQQNIEKVRENFIDYGKFLQRYRREDSLQNYLEFLNRDGVNFRAYETKETISCYLTELIENEIDMVAINTSTNEFIVFSNFDYRWDDYSLHIEDNEKELQINIDNESTIIEELNDVDFVTSVAFDCFRLEVL